MTQIIAVEVDGIQQWVLGGTAELRVIRGGSLLLDRTFEHVEDILAQTIGQSAADPATTPVEAAWSLPVCSSGTATVIVGDELPVADAVRALRRHFAACLPTASVRLGQAAWTAGTPFSAARRAAMASLRPVTTVQVSAHVPGTRLCTSCGVASASPRPVRFGDAHSVPWHLCAACGVRGRLVPTSDELPDGAEAAYEIGKIGAKTVGPRWRGYVATICADGNAQGRRFAQIDDPATLQRESRQLLGDVRATVNAALEAAVADHREVTGDATAVLPVNRLMQAGDDIRLIVPAHVALTVMKELALASSSTSFEACAAAVITPASVPFSATHELAEELLARAKARARAIDPDHPRPQVAFMVSSAAFPTIETDDALMGSPYDAEHAQRLLDVADRLTASASSIRAAAAAVWRDGAVEGRAAEREWLLFRHRLQNGERAAIDELWDTLRGDAARSSPGHLPIDDRPLAGGDGGTSWGPVRRSPLHDLLFLRQVRRAAPVGARSAEVSA